MGVRVEEDIFLEQNLVDVVYYVINVVQLQIRVGIVIDIVVYFYIEFEVIILIDGVVIVMVGDVDVVMVQVEFVDIWIEGEVVYFLVSIVN